MLSIMHNLYEPTGVEITQHDFVRISAGAPGLLLLEGSSSRTAPESVPITWEEFVRDLVPRAESLLAQRLDEETYVAQLASQLKEMTSPAIPLWNGLASHHLWTVTEVQLDESLGFPHHDHRQYNGVIFVLEGQVHIRNYDILGSERTPSAGCRTRIRETVNHVFKTGECSTLTTTRDNIHDVRGGPGGCRLLDIFTWLGPDPQSVDLEIDENPIEPKSKIHWASFLG